MSTSRTSAVFLLVCALAVPTPARQAVRSELRFDASAAEHLLNRAGFGASPEEIERAVEDGLEATVLRLLSPDDDPLPPYFERIRRRSAMRDRAGEEELTDAERRKLQNRIRRDDRDQLSDFLDWWMEQLIESEHPLRERMTLFWHGHFTSSMDDVKNSHEMIQQVLLLRGHSLGNFRELVHAIARDPAMLEYLDNDVNRRDHPNENFARELMELFTLGEGNYTEDDVQEAARAFTGWSDSDGAFRFNGKQHDHGPKTVFGVTAKMDGDEVIDLILDRPDCARFLAGELVTYFEGATPEEARLERLAGVLYDADYDLPTLLQALFTDPDFYRADVRGARIASPIDFLVGSTRRLQADPPAYLLLLAANLLGERLLFPPNVKGWEGGAAWVTTSSLMQRGNLAGVLLGEVTMEDFLDYDIDEVLDPTMLAEDEDVAMDGMSGSMQADDGLAREAMDDKRALGELRRLRDIRKSWTPRMNLTGAVRGADARSDEEVVDALVDRLLAIDVDAETRATLTRLLEREREAIACSEEEFLEHSWRSERPLRRLAHVILSLPEAQLH